ncbi:uncharacterized protein SPPG_07038 [Spizellomyces punctatus DAOM BR117]|uniref:Uncharacterized protein n=1 Tax=Spizellomyces punctatus (strain DAOM BR117) TaxID=645134 RepID=A0A0L0H7S5_SPIPD|nr:uncharacterized protein SPPG_07038 [Spizellomyces punctatus DAOM BR117]KNC97565.1 hypothetical protein SPPG_07038 [Spizellomyces punctatus DAOM BR117]|eukprot:XP_016605605.1 hypothetical protein SPPG_07038 [Spizellomyces punctatus DAOM BR117]
METLDDNTMGSVLEQTTLEKVRLGCVPEHFSSPVYQAVANELFGQHGLDVEIISCPGGTGEMVNMLNTGQLDVAIALTEGLVASLVNTDAQFRLIGTYVSTPLTWSIATSPNGSHASTPRESPGPEAWKGLQNCKIGISRFGSGSHIIPYVMADELGWLEEEKEPFSFVPLKNIHGLVEGVRDGTVDAFLWERIMTKPFYDSGTLHHLSNITPPWPAFLLAATPKALAATQALRGMLDAITTQSQAFFQGRETGSSIKYVADRFKLPEEDVKTWFASVEYPRNSRELSRKVILDCVRVLKKAGVIADRKRDVKLEDLVDERVAILRD